MSAWKKLGSVSVLGALPLVVKAHGDHDFHDALTQSIHGLGHMEVLGSIIALAIVGVLLVRYVGKRKP